MKVVPTTPWLYAEEQQEVIAFLLERDLIKHDNSRQLPLKNGGKTDVYINLRDARDHPGASSFIAELFSHPLRRLGIDRFLEVPDSVSGFASILSDNIGLPYLTVRGEAKEGRVADAKIIGHPNRGESVATIDDVITNGASKLAAEAICRELGLNHRALVVLVDRQQGWQDDFERLGIKVPVWAGMTLHDVRRHLIQTLGVMQRCDPAIEDKNRLIMALDRKSWDEILPVIERARTAGLIFKVNDLAIGGDTQWVLKNLSVYGRVMLDLKVHDISNTAVNICRRLRDHAPWALTVHASGATRMINETAHALLGTPTKVLAVTLLTSIDPVTSKEIYCRQPITVVKKLAEMAYEAGAHGFVCSSKETATLRQMFPSAIIVNPGIRSPGASTDDQERIGTPAGAIDAGADYLVMGRQLMRAVDPFAEATRVHREELGIDI